MPAPDEYTDFGSPAYRAGYDAAHYDQPRLVPVQFVDQSRAYFQGFDYQRSMTFSVRGEGEV